MADAIRLLLLPVLLVYSVLVLVALELGLAGRRETDGLHGDALEQVDRFVAQYPLHPYPILAKSLELAHLLRELPQHARAAERIVELAIGEGTLSRHVFPAESQVVAADIAPYNLRFAARMAHVRTAIVCDCLDPPFAEGSFDLLVSNNFLHHVSAKTETLARWGRIASVLVFSENTRYWASGWARPFMFRRLGFHAAATRAESEIEESHFQDLATLGELDEIAARGRRVLSRETCFGERTFFIASTFSMFMRCTGPPTPPVVKRLLLGPLRMLALPLTRRIARDLIRYDAAISRERDVYVLYALGSDTWSPTQGSLICPTCRGPIDRGSCTSCGKRYTELDGMLFVLPDELAHIERDYDVAASAARAAEQL